MHSSLFADYSFVERNEPQKESVRRLNMFEKKGFSKNIISRLGRAFFSMNFILIFLSVTASPQTAEKTDGAINAATRKLVVEKVSALLMKNYISAEVAEKIARQLQVNIKSGKYDKFNDPKEFAQAINTDLAEIGKDRHFYFAFDPQTYDKLTGKKVEAASGNAEDDLRKERYQNFGLRKVERLTGNIGYLELLSNSSYAGSEAGDAIVGAMNFIANTDAVIIDVRKNPGGSGQINQLIGSYFFEPGEDKWLISNRNRSRGTFKQEWTLPYVPGKRMPKTDLYILIGPDTGSAAEGLAYTLQTLKRAVVVGEPSYGGANSGDLVAVEVGFVFFLPTGQTVSPITNSNWDGTGVQPDVRVKPELALLKAQALILSKIAGKETDPAKIEEAKWFSQEYNAEIAPVVVAPNILKSYEGKFGQRTITFENGELYHQREGRPKYKLVALEESLFRINGVENYHLQFNKDSEGKINKITVLVYRGFGEKIYTEILQRNN